MTRQNANLKRAFSDELLLNALGEEPRILRAVIERIGKNHKFNDIPPAFTLGKGHMKFFFDKCEFIYRRYYELRQEYKHRHGKVYSRSHLARITARYKYILKKRPDLCNDWEPTEEANELVRQRILGLSKNYKKQHKHYNLPVTNFESLLYGNT